MVDTTRPINILGIPGSLRQASYNKAALKAAQELIPAGATLEVFGLDGIPPFNEDDERALPPRVVELKVRVREADAILIATPEYNYSVPGVLKNAIDWASRPYGKQCLGRQTGCAHGGIARLPRDGSGAVSPASVIRIPEHVPAEPTRGHDLKRGAALRRTGSPHGRRVADTNTATPGGARGLDAATENRELVSLVTLPSQVSFLRVQLRGGS
jgi:multimeric flavodoxin WrbA